MSTLYKYPPGHAEYFRLPRVYSSAGESFFESGHHLIGEAVVSGLKDDLIPGVPAGFFELILVHMDGRIAVNIAVETCQEVIDDSPWLRLIIADVLDADAGFFHNFALNSLLEGLADLGKSGDEGVEGNIAAG